MKKLLLGLLLSSLLLNAGELEEIQKACKNNDLLKCEELGSVYELGIYEVKQDYKKAIKLYKKVCDSGLSHGCTSLAFVYRNEDYIDTNDTKAQELRIKAKKIATEACKLNNAEECLSLAVIYSIGLGVTKDNFKAFKLYKKSCDGDNARGCRNLGSSYFDGKGIRQNYSKANDSFKKSCALGDNYACVKLGDSYANGLGTKKDNIKALDLYGKTCDAGVSEGCEKYATVNKMIH